MVLMKTVKEIKEALGVCKSYILEELSESQELDVYDFISELEDIMDVSGAIPILFEKFGLSGTARIWYPNRKCRTKIDYTSKGNKIDMLEFYVNGNVKQHQIYKEKGYMVYHYNESGNKTEEYFVNG